MNKLNLSEAAKVEIADEARSIREQIGVLEKLLGVKRAYPVTVPLARALMALERIVSHETEATNARG